MVTKKQAVNEDLVRAFLDAKPANPALTSSDKAYLRGLKRRGFTDDEIKNVAQKAGFIVPPELLVAKVRKPKNAQ